jgi:hypothetical protein
VWRPERRPLADNLSMTDRYDDRRGEMAQVVAASEEQYPLRPQIDRWEVEEMVPGHEYMALWRHRKNRERIFLDEIDQRNAKVFLTYHLVGKYPGRTASHCLRDIEHSEFELSDR